MMARRQRHGVAILMALLVVALAGGVLGVCARRSAQSALAAGEDLQQLQLRWAGIGIREVILPQLPGLLERARRPHEEPALSTELALTLGCLDVRVLIADEQAKANVNTLGSQMDDASLAQTLQQLQAMSHQPLAVEIRAAARATRRPTLARPSASAAQSSNPRRARSSGPGQIAPTGDGRFVSFDQFIRFDHPRRLLVDPARSLAGQITCWGDGRINWHVADEPALRAVLGNLLSGAQVRKLMDLRRKPDLKAGQAIAELALTKEKAEAVAALLADQSQCHSAWVVLSNRQRQWYRLYVTQGEGGRQWSYAW